MRTVDSPPEMVWLQVAAAVVGIVIVIATAVTAGILDVANEFLTREPQRALHGRPSAGLMSNVGAGIWSIGFVCAALAASLTRGRTQQLFLAGTALVGFMYVDDFFMLHDAVFPKLGLPEILVSATYFAGMAAIAWFFRAELGREALIGFGVAAALFIGAAIFDRFLNESDLNLEQLTEDGLKLIGICVWVSVWVGLARRELQARPA